MIRLDQIKILESKVNRAVDTIRVLREENKALKRTVEKSQARLEELESMVSDFKSEQDQIEQGILRALKNLDKLEDEAGAAGRGKAKPQPPPPPPQEPAEVQEQEQPVAEDASEEPETEETGEGQLDIF